MCVQIVEPSLPLASERFNPISNIFKSDCDQLAWPPLRIAAARNQARMLKNIEVLGNRRLAQIERLHKLGYVCVSQRQASEDRAPRGVRECAEDQIKRVLLDDRHMAIYLYGD